MFLLKHAIASLTVAQLKERLALLPGGSRSGKKDELVQTLLGRLTDQGLRSLWQGMNEIEKLAVSESLYAPDLTYNAARFAAKYGRRPKTDRSSGETLPSFLTLMLHSLDGAYRIPDDMAESLKTFVPPPPATRLETVDSLPESWGEEPLTQRVCERDAPMDLTVMLHLVDQGRIKVSEKTSLAGNVVLNYLTGQVTGGDFYPWIPKENKWDQEIGPIKAFAWPLLLQAGGLAQKNGAKLALTPAGFKALKSPPADALRGLWRKWLKSAMLDEFSRMDDIKGQKSAGKHMTALAPRRTAIAGALQDCPVGVWIDVDRFSRYMVASGQTFRVTHEPWKLYLQDPNYGSLGYDGSNGWNILQFRYLLCFLFEYAATLGVIDVAYVPPENAREDFHGMWGADDMAYLSRYDGLCYFRLTPLGAYCLDLSDAYQPEPLRSTVRLSILPGLQINVASGHLAPEEALFLDTWAVQATPDSWRLERGKLLSCVEKGLDVTAFEAFLEARDDQPLPETVEALLKTCAKQGKALRRIGNALLLECQDAETAALIASHKETAGLCLRAGERHLVVRQEHEERFLALVRVAGFGVQASA